MENKIYKNDSGTVIYLDFQESVSAAVSASIKVLYPNGVTTASWTATASGNQIYYVMTSADTNATGTYKLQGYVELGTWKGRSETVPMIVYDIFK